MAMGILSWLRSKLGRKTDTGMREPTASAEEERDSHCSSRGNSQEQLKKAVTDSSPHVSKVCVPLRNEAPELKKKSEQPYPAATDKTSVAEKTRSGTVVASQNEINPKAKELRLDGVYQSQPLPNGSWLYIRFLEDFNVITVISANKPEDLSSWFNKGHTGISHGTYSVQGSAVKFTVERETGNTDYQGEIGEDSLELDVFSHISNERFHNSCRFVKLPAPSSEKRQELERQINRLSDRYAPDSLGG